MINPLEVATDGLIGDKTSLLMASRGFISKAVIFVDGWTNRISVKLNVATAFKTILGVR